MDSVVSLKMEAWVQPIDSILPLRTDVFISQREHCI
jgi:hypothetical protein